MQSPRPDWRSLFPPFVRPYYREPLFVARAEGVRVTDEAGREYLDAYAGVATLCLGHRPQAVERAVALQAERFGHLSWIYLHDLAVRYAARLLAAAGAPLSRVFFVNSGSEAVDLALVLARMAGGGPVVALTEGFHGGTHLAAHATGLPAWRPPGEAPGEIRFAATPDCGRCEERAACGDGRVPCIEEVRIKIREGAQGLRPCTPPGVTGVNPPSHIPCFVPVRAPRPILLLEPVLGVGGVVVPPQRWFRALAGLRAETGALLVIDEVQSGFGRLGEKLFGYQKFGLVPDMVCLGKGIAGGMPLGALLMTEGCSAAAAELLHFSTFGGHPLSLAAADATLSEIEAHDLPGRVAELGARFLAGLAALARPGGPALEARGAGYFLGLRMRDGAAAAALLEACRAEGLLVGLGGLARDVVRIEPALVFAGEHVDEALDRLGRAMASLR